MMQTNIRGSVQAIDKPPRILLIRLYQYKTSGFNTDNEPDRLNQFQRSFRHLSIVMQDNHPAISFI